MPKGKASKSLNCRSRRKLTEEQRRLLMMEPEDWDFSQNEVLRKIHELVSAWPLEVRRQWAEEWRKEHRQGK
jgi:hypothetical protein